MLTFKILQVKTFFWVLGGTYRHLVPLVPLTNTPLLYCVADGVICRSPLSNPSCKHTRERDGGWGGLRHKKSSNEKTPCWPYRHPGMLVDSALRQQWYRNMAVSIAQRPAADAPVLLLTFLITLIFHHSVADVAAGAATTQDLPHRRFEYKYSFKGPHLAQTDGSIPFWIHTGSKFVSSCQPRRASYRRMLWCDAR